MAAMERGVLTALFVGALLVCSISSSPVPAPFSDHCIVGERSLYPPANRSVPTYTVDLDQPANQRWNHVIAEQAPGIIKLVEAIKKLLTSVVGSSIVNFLDNGLGRWNNRFPQPYADEIASIANVTGLPLGDIVLYNIFYEIFSVCTSIVAEDPQGRLYHARNLDFGLFLGWDPETHDWLTTELLRDIVINVNWVRGNETLYKSVNFAGFIGIFNGVRPQRFTVTANERYALDGGFMGIIQWLLGDRTEKWMTWLVREVMETAESFDEAVSRLGKTPVMAPVYYIVGGNSSGQGVILTRSRETTLSTVSLNSTTDNGWYVLETNYDPDVKPLFLDDRRTPGNVCMRKLGRANVGFEGIFNVLSSPTTLNKLTAYTTLMQVNDGTLETYIQKCPDPCWAW